MEPIRVYYNGSVFIPFDQVSLQKDTYYDMVFTKDEEEERKAEKIAALKKIYAELDELDKTEPLPDEFFDIVKRRDPKPEELDP